MRNNAALYTDRLNAARRIGRLHEHWRCPACRVAITHNELEDRPRPGASYRCHICLLELTLDMTTDTLMVVPFPSEINERHRPF